jgi:RNA polymerase sigma-70 factor (ECF subfamily)
MSYHTQVYQPTGSSTMVAGLATRPPAELGDSPQGEASLTRQVSGPRQRDATPLQRSSSRSRLRVVAGGGDRENPDSTIPAASQSPLTRTEGGSPERPSLEQVASVDSTENAHSSPERTAAATPEADFRTLYETHFRTVWSSLSRLGVREEDLMDLTQKVFLTAYLKLPGFEGRSLLSTWLWSISRRVAIAHRRSGPARREVATDPSSFEGLPEESNNVASNGESAQQAQVILGKLTEAQRVVFLLFEVDQMSGREIATLLDVPLGTVRSRLRYARKVFRRETERLKAVQKTARR